MTKKPADLGNRSACRPDIIYDQDIPCGQLHTVKQSERISDILQPFLHVQPRLGAGSLDTAKAREYGDSQPAGQGMTEVRGLVETPFSDSAWVSWNGHDPGGAGLESASAEAFLQEGGQWMSQMAMSFKFEFPNRFPQLSGVRSVGTGKIEGGRPCSAHRTDSLER